MAAWLVHSTHDSDSHPFQPCQRTDNVAASGNYFAEVQQHSGTHCAHHAARVENGFSAHLTQREVHSTQTRALGEVVDGIAVDTQLHTQRMQ